MVLMIGYSLSLIGMTLNSETSLGGKTALSQEILATTEMGNASTATKTLGNPFYEENTKSTGIRVLDVSHGPKIEISFSGNGTIDGTTNVTNIGTI